MIYFRANYNSHIFMKRFKSFKNFAKRSEVHSSFSPDDCTPSIVVLIFLFRLSIFIGLVPDVVNSAKLCMMDSNAATVS